MNWHMLHVENSVIKRIEEELIQVLMMNRYFGTFCFPFNLKKIFELGM